MRYAVAFLLAALALTAATVTTYRRLSVASAAVTASLPVADTLERSTVHTPLHPSAADYARFEAADRAWRAEHARRYSLAELRARGDGRRSPRERMDDTVFALTRRGDRAGAVRVLERWTAAHPRDRTAILALARLLNEMGRSEASVERYRQLLALGDGR